MFSFHCALSVDLIWSMHFCLFIDWFSICTDPQIIISMYCRVIDHHWKFVTPLKFSLLHSVTIRTLMLKMLYFCSVPGRPIISLWLAVWPWNAKGSYSETVVYLYRFLKLLGLIGNFTAVNRMFNVNCEHLCFMWNNSSNFSTVDVLADNGRLSLTPDVITAFGKMMSAHRGEVTCSVTTAQVRLQVLFCFLLFQQAFGLVVMMCIISIYSII